MRPPEHVRRDKKALRAWTEWAAKQSGWWADVAEEDRRRRDRKRRGY